MNNNNLEHPVYRYSCGAWDKCNITPPTEASLRIIVNGTELLTVLCTPEKLEYLAVGYLYTERYIYSVGDIESIDVDMEDFTVRIKLAGCEFEPSKRRIKTSGFGGALISGEDLGDISIDPDFKISPEKIISFMEELKDKGVLYKKTGGVHSSALCTRDAMIVQAEDIGRHNTMDKVIGEYLMRGMSVKDMIMLTTGRMSEEMVLKTARLGIPLIASLSSPTSKAVNVAEKYGIATVGYVGKNSMLLYSAAHRLKK
jgi:FdhD protein